MMVDVEKLKIDSEKALVQLSYMTAVLEEYQAALDSFKKTDSNFYRHFIADKDTKELVEYSQSLHMLKGMESLLPRLYGQMDLIDDYKYVMGLKDCLRGSVPEMIKLLGYIGGSKSADIERKLMVQIGLNGENLAEVNARYQKERNKLSNRAVDKETFISYTEMRKQVKVNSGSTVTNRITTGNIAVEVKNARVGDFITFGNYPQGKDGNVNPIEWRVLAKENGRLLLISKYALDCKKYNERNRNTTWENCTIRMWLNGDFVNNAFNEKEKSAIPAVIITADKNPAYNTDPGNNTKDKVFLLSILEAKKYLASNEDRKCVPSDYAIVKKTHTNHSHKADGKPTCWWWLRSPGYSGGSAEDILPDGSFNEFGEFVGTGHHGVRPALWINL